LHGLTGHGFPNWFAIGFNQNSLSPNMTAMFDDQVVHVSSIIDASMQNSPIAPRINAFNTLLAEWRGERDLVETDLR